MNDDIDIDKIFDQAKNIKPITEGLGFHHEKKSDEKLSLNSKKSMLESDLENRSKTIINKSMTKKTFGNSATMGDLSAFYEKPQIESVDPIVNKTEKVICEDASVGERLLAYVLDVFAVTAIFTSIIALSIIASPLPQDLLIRGFLDYSFVYDGLALYSLLFIFYFSFFDRSEFSTLGKNIMGIKLRSINGKVTYSQTLLRSVSLLIGMATFGLTSLLGLNNILSRTELTKR